MIKPIDEIPKNVNEQRKSYRQQICNDIQEAIDSGEYSAKSNQIWNRQSERLQKECAKNMKRRVKRDEIHSNL